MKHLLNTLQNTFSFEETLVSSYNKTHTHTHTHTHTNTRDVLVTFTEIVGSNNITERSQCIEKINPIC